MRISAPLCQSVCLPNIRFQFINIQNQIMSIHQSMFSFVWNCFPLDWHNRFPFICFTEISHSHCRLTHRTQPPPPFHIAKLSNGAMPSCNQRFKNSILVHIRKHAMPKSTSYSAIPPADIQFHTQCNKKRPSTNDRKAFMMKGKH